MSKVSDINAAATPPPKPKRAVKRGGGSLVTLYRSFCPTHLDNTLFRFADGVDYQLMGVGFVLALVQVLLKKLFFRISLIVQAVLPPFVWLIMGDFVSFAIEREVIIKSQLKFIKVQIWILDGKAKSNSGTRKVGGFGALHRQRHVGRLVCGSTKCRGSEICSERCASFYCNALAFLCHIYCGFYSGYFLNNFIFQL